MNDTQRATPGTRVFIPAHVHAREFEGEMVIVDLEAGQYYALDEVGTRLWNGMSAGKTAREVAIDIEPHYDVTLATLVADLSALCDEWLARGLVQLQA